MIETNKSAGKNSKGERWLVDELVNAGHKSFGIVEGPPDSVASASQISCRNTAALPMPSSLPMILWPSAALMKPAKNSDLRFRVIFQSSASMA